MIKVRILPGAQKEFLELPDKARKSVVDKVDLLRRFPRMGCKMLAPYTGFRAILACRQRYRIIYRLIDEELIEIAYIRHCRRQLGLRVVREEE